LPAAGLFLLFLAGCGAGSPATLASSAEEGPPPPPAATIEADQSGAPSPSGAEQQIANGSQEPVPGSSPADGPRPEVVASEAATSGGGSDAAGEAAPAEQAAAAPAGDGGAAANLANPFPQRLVAPEFPKNVAWLNSRPLTKADLKGKFVLLDFWTYCCINCMHILPELKKLEQQFPNNLVVIGVHSAKFDTEKVTDNIRDAVMRYEIVHPVINDSQMELWRDDLYRVSSWPTIILIDPEGMAVWGKSGEFKADLVSTILTTAIPYYRGKKLLDEKPRKFDLEADKEQPTPLRFPGKVLADEKGNRLFISDSNHNRIVIATLDGSLLDVIGSGEIGRGDGDYRSATFNHPQGCALHGETLYVADTENHLLRKVDLAKKTVTTIAGTGEQGGLTDAYPGWNGNAARGQRQRWVGAPLNSPLNSPWALIVHKNDLFIAMAGYHQIWKMPLDEKEIGPFAGNGREDINDGPKLPADPLRAGSSFAQPSGLSTDGSHLFVADSEGSSIRAVPFEGATTKVHTVIGTSQMSEGRLFTFGDKDGPRGTARLQHCLEVVFLGGKLYVADTYNHKIKVVDPKTGDTKTFAGTGKPGAGNNEFHEPAGLTAANGKMYVADTNNHLLRTIDLASGKVETLTIAGLKPPGAADGAVAGGNGGSDAPPDSPAVPHTPSTSKKPSFQGAHEERLPAANVKASGGVVKLHVSLQVPPGWKINPQAPMAYWLDSPRASGVAERGAFGRVKLDHPMAEFDVPVRVAGAGEDELQISLPYYYCQTKDEGVCKIGAVVFTIPLVVSSEGNAEPLKLVHTIAE
jgi:thiol-disulfide isomerase/thioredoxin/sugar lactone lactonase YvrE